MRTTTTLIGALLALLTVTGCVSFSANAQGSSPSLAGTSWKLAQFGNRDALVAGADVTLVFERDVARAGGRASVNHYSGTIVQQGETLTFSQLARTLMAGPEPLMSQEERFVSSLERVRTYRLTGGELSLLDAAGQPLLVFATA